VSGLNFDPDFFLHIVKGSKALFLLPLLIDNFIACRRFSDLWGFPQRSLFGSWEWSLPLPGPEWLSLLDGSTSIPECRRVLFTSPPFL